MRIRKGNLSFFQICDVFSCTQMESPCVAPPCARFPDSQSSTQSNSRFRLLLATPGLSFFHNFPSPPEIPGASPLFTTMGATFLFFSPVKDLPNVTTKTHFCPQEPSVDLAGVSPLSHPQAPIAIPRELAQNRRCRVPFLPSSRNASLPIPESFPLNSLSPPIGQSGLSGSIEG